MCNRLRLFENRINKRRRQDEFRTGPFNGFLFFPQKNRLASSRDCSAVTAGRAPSPGSARPATTTTVAPRSSRRTNGSTRAYNPNSPSPRKPKKYVPVAITRHFLNFQSFDRLNRVSLRFSPASYNSCTPVVLTTSRYRYLLHERPFPYRSRFSFHYCRRPTIIPDSVRSPRNVIVPEFFCPPNFRRFSLAPLISTMFFLTRHTVTKYKLLFSYRLNASLSALPAVFAVYSTQQTFRYDLQLH